MNWPNVGKLRSENNDKMAKIMPIWVKYEGYCCLTLTPLM